MGVRAWNYLVFYYNQVLGIPGSLIGLAAGTRMVGFVLLVPAFVAAVTARSGPLVDRLRGALTDRRFLLISASAVIVLIAVQPYVALGLGLQTVGHQVQIATDPLFQSFIENHGLGFAPVNADPRQAMQEDIRQIGSNPIRLLRSYRQSGRW